MMHAKQIFLEAIEQHAPDEWDQYLDRACGNDLALRQRVAQLLAAHLQENQLLDNGALVDVISASPVVERPGMMVGPYRLGSEIGEGGFGIIFAAEQSQPMRRSVAIKILKPGIDTRQVVARFEAERQALALMDHPNIARIFDGGVAPSGRPFFAMELVDGLPITKFCEQRGLTLKERLTLFIDVCQAVQHAHLKGIIHRDLKPSNVLVQPGEDRPLVKVIDFGIAKAIGHTRLSDKSIFTEVSQFVGTPAYMSPEQVALGTLDLDTRSDVYSLGVLLFEMLVSVPPFSEGELIAVGPDEMRRMIREDMPQRPSVRRRLLAGTVDPQVGSPKPGDSRQLLIPREIDWIVLKALEKDRGRRYQSAVDLAADVKAFLRGEAVTACPPSRVYRISTYLRRNGLAVAAVSAVAMAMLLAALISLRYAYQADAAKRLADKNALNERLARKEVQAREANLRLELYHGGIFDAAHAWQNGDWQQVESILDRFVPGSDQQDLREFSWHYLKLRCSNRNTGVAGHDREILAATMSPDGKVLASADQAGIVKIWDFAARSELHSWRPSEQETYAVAFAPDGRTLATSGRDRVIRLWKVANWSEEARLEGHTQDVRSISWSPDGQHLASGSADGSVRIWSPSTRREEARFHDPERGVRCVLWLADGRRIVAGFKNVLRLLNVEDHSQNHLATHADDLLALAADPQNQLLAAGGYGTVVSIYDLTTDQLMVEHESKPIWSLAFSTDGRELYAGQQNKGLLAWSVGRHSHQMVMMHDGARGDVGIKAVLVHPTQDELVLLPQTGSRVQWDRRNELVGYTFVALDSDLLAIDLKRDWAFTSASDFGIVVRKYSDGQVLHQLRGHQARTLSATLSSSRRRLATVGADAEMLVWDLDSLQLLNKFKLPSSEIGQLARIAFSPDDSLVAVGSLASPGMVWRVQDGEPISEVPAQGKIRFAFSPNGEWLATKNGTLGCTLTGLRSGKVSLSFGTGRYFEDLLFTPDGKRLVAAEDENLLTVWDAATGEELHRLPCGRTTCHRIAISPDSRTLVALTSDQSILLWDLASGRSLFRLMQHSAELDWVEFVSDRKLVVGATDDSSRGLVKCPKGVFVFDADAKGQEVPRFVETECEPNAAGMAVLAAPIFDFSVGYSPFDVANPDLNGDGKPDLAVTNADTNTVSVLINTTVPGATVPSYAPKVEFATGNWPRRMAVGDLNADGRPDLVIANARSNTMSVLLNSTPPGAITPSFQPQVNFDTQSFPFSLAIKDLNGDDRPDLAVANAGSNTVSVLLNTTEPGAATASYAPAARFATGPSPWSIAIGDLNRDGKPDLAVANMESDSVSVLFNTTASGAVTPDFSVRTDFATEVHPSDIGIADFNGDGNSDLAVTNINSNNVTILPNTTSPGAAVPAFSSSSNVETGTAPHSLEIGDLNDDGKVDLAITNSASNSVSLLLNTTKGAATPSFAGKADLATGSQPLGVAIGDVNEDGKTDLSIANHEADTVSVLLNTPATIRGAAR
ncbi:MAG: FG-GAP-like repeat-containing protein [Pirellulales bacterium]